MATTVPVVGPKQLHIAQLSPRARKILAHRARQAARREYAPVKAADRQAIGLVNREYGVQARSAKAATNMVGASLTQALQKLPSTGLSGGYLKQAANELAARRADAASSLLFLLADAGSERRKGLIEAKTQLISDRADQQKSAAEKLNSLLSSERDAASSYLAAQEKAQKPSKSEAKSLANAATALHDYLSHWKAEPVLQEANPLKTNADYAEAAHWLAKKYEGVSLADAAKVLAATRARWKKDPNKFLHGLVFNPGTE
jgi:hypothetical protein